VTVFQITEGIDIAVADHGRRHAQHRLRQNACVSGTDEVLMIRAQCGGNPRGFRTVDKIVLQVESGQIGSETFHRNAGQTEALQDLDRRENIDVGKRIRMIQCVRNELDRLIVQQLIGFRHSFIGEVAAAESFKMKSHADPFSRLFGIGIQTFPDPVPVCSGNIHSVRSSDPRFPVRAGSLSSPC
jgi:hypothetical protein